MKTVRNPLLMLIGLSAAALLGSSVASAGDNSDVAAPPERAPAPRDVNLGGILKVDSDDTPAFTPDGNTVFFDRTSGSHKFVMMAHRINGHWGAPEIAPFSGHAYDQNPVVAPDGSFLIFDSDRPISRTGISLVQTFFGKPNPGSNLWRVDLKGAGWGQPVWLGAAVNDSAFIDFPS